MSTINDGGPAFPTPGEDFIEGPQGRQPASAWGMEGKPGMSLRDWFAGQALAGMMANADIPFAVDHAECEPRQIANAVYELADAMLAERAKIGGES